MIGYIYKITNDINNKVYIGKTLHCSIQERFKEHCQDANRKKTENRPLYRAMRKYGIEHFHIEEIEAVESELLSIREQYWIKEFKSFGHLGYNATIGGDGTQLYDYNIIIDKFKQGKLMTEIAKEMCCSVDTVSNAIERAGLNPRQNSIHKDKKSIIMSDKSGNTIHIFNSRREAGDWLINCQYAKTNDVDNVIAAIGRVANGKRKTAYGFIWKNNV